MSGEAAEKEQRMRANVLQELVASEGNYLRDLSVLQRLFIDPLQADKQFLKDARDLDKGHKGDILMLFHTVALICEANGEFLRLLSSAVESASESGVSDAVAQLAEKHLSYYSVFCNHQAEAMADAKRLQRTSESFVRICEQASAHADAAGLALLDFLVKPFQRLLKYPLLLRELIKYTPVGHAARAGLEAAMAKIQTVVDEVDRNKAKADNLKRMLALNSRISGLPRALEPLVTPARRLVREGWVRKISSGNDQERHLALFNDLLVYSKRKGGDKLLFRDSIWLKQLQVTALDDTDAIQHAIQLHRLDKKLTYIIYCETRLEKTEWHRDFVATQEMLKTLALSQTKYSDKDEYKDCIGAVRIYYEEEGQELFKTFAIGTQVHAADVMRQFAAKLRIADGLQQLGAELQLQLLSGADASFVPPTASPLAIQLEAIKRGAQFPSPQHRFFVQLPMRATALTRATSTKSPTASTAAPSASTDVSHMVVDAPLAGHSARASAGDTGTQTIDFSLWTGGDMEALKAAVRSNTGSSMSISEPSDRTASTSVEDSESGMGSVVDLLDAVLSGDNRTLRRVATKAKIGLSIPESASEREARTSDTDTQAIIDSIVADASATTSALPRVTPPSSAAAAAAAAVPVSEPLPKLTPPSRSGGVHSLISQFNTGPRQPATAAAAPAAAAVTTIDATAASLKRAPPLPTKSGLPPDAAALALAPPTKRAPTRSSTPLTSAEKLPPASGDVDLMAIAEPKKRAPIRSSLGSSSRSSEPSSPRESATPAAAAAAPTVASDGDDLLSLGASSPPQRGSDTEAIAPMTVTEAQTSGGKTDAKTQSTLKRFFGLGKKKTKDDEPPAAAEPVSEINF